MFVSTTQGGPVVAPCRHGTFSFHPTDMIGRMLYRYGEWAEHEVRLLTSLVRPGDIVLDVGAHIGTISIPLAKAVGPEGLLIAFEAQRSVFYNLSTNVHLNGLENVLARNCMVGATAGSVSLMDIAWKDQRNSGGFSIPIGARSPQSYRGTPVIVLDDALRDLPRCRLVKMDIEGHEPEALRGMAETIRRLKPAIYLETNTEAGFVQIREMLGGFGYRLFWHCEPHWNERNYRDCRENLYGSKTDLNVAAFPDTWTDTIPEILTPAEDFASMARRAQG